MERNRRVIAAINHTNLTRRTRVFCRTSSVNHIWRGEGFCHVIVVEGLKQRRRESDRYYSFNTFNFLYTITIIGLIRIDRITAIHAHIGLTTRLSYVILRVDCIRNKCQGTLKPAHSLSIKGNRELFIPN